jgi:CDP-glucose 4,6-dehydratase
MEGLVNMRSFWHGKKVFITGHTGFKGGWLSFWLWSMGAQVCGYSLAPKTQPNFFEALNLDSLFESNIGDIRDEVALRRAMLSFKPEIVFHLAAQPLVRQSYDDPIETFQTNVMGTVNLLEAVRAQPCTRAVVNITTDKCYKNFEWVWPYRESDPLGGHDPYASSKACSELVAESYRRSFFERLNIGIATARAGNVIGGGDWSEDRLIPDVIRAINGGETLVVRSPNALRPWQHVIDPLGGYLKLAEKLYQFPQEYSSAWNFGPTVSSELTVQQIIDRILSAGVRLKVEILRDDSKHEATLLKLDSSKAISKLNWHPAWSIDHALEKTLDWYDAKDRGDDLRDFSLNQINDAYPS